jgi:hypothetical protein
LLPEDNKNEFPAVLVEMKEILNCNTNGERE